MQGRAVLAALLVVVSCKDAQKSPPASAPAKPTVDWTRCDAAVTTAASAPLAARPALLIGGCRVCGDWTPILHWNAPTANGGPPRDAIEQAMMACDAFCVGDAKLKFSGTLDNARGRSSRTPWKQLAAVCKERVSAVPDDRFMEGAYFALDRIARRVGERADQTATTLAALDIPLPAVSVTGQGPSLPNASHSTDVTGELHVTVLGATISVGALPRARLTKDGVKVELGAAPYPGKPVTVAELEQALVTLGSDKSKLVSVLAPPATPAKNLIPIIAAASKVATVRLATKAPSSLPSWELVGTIPIALESSGPDVIHVTESMTVDQLAVEIDMRVDAKAERVGITGP
jgi:hypothetical protein